MCMGRLTRSYGEERFVSYGRRQDSAMSLTDTAVMFQPDRIPFFALTCRPLERVALLWT